MARLIGVQSALSHHQSNAHLLLERDLIAVLINILRDEELLWFQKSRANWIELGERNTKFFHSTTIAKRKRKYIHSLKLELEFMV